MIHDLQSAFRSIRKHPWFSLAIIATLALGIGMNTTVFNLANAVLFKPVPVPNGDRLVNVQGQNLSNEQRGFDGISYPDFIELQNQNSTFELLEAVNFYQTVISDEGNPPERVSIVKISPRLFDVVSAKPILGQSFTLKDGEFLTPDEIVLSYELWQNRYAGAEDIVGHSINVNGNAAEVVGVMPKGFKFPQNEMIWMPLVVTTTGAFHIRSNRWIQGYGLLKKGTSIEEAGSDIALIGQRLEAEFPDTNKDFSFSVQTFHERFNGGEIKLLFLLMLGAVAFVLLIACANVANMMLGRAIALHSDTSIRAALGASRWQICRLFLVECVTLSVIGGLLGLGITLFGVDAFDKATAEIRPYWIDFSMDYKVFAYFAAISVASGLIFGLAPALRSSRFDLNSAMKEGARSSSSAGKGRLTNLLVVFQFSMTLVLLLGAGLMIRGFFLSKSYNAFIPAESYFTARIILPQAEGERYEDPNDRRIFYETLLDRLGAIPGVSHAAAATSLPALGSNVRSIEIDGRPVIDEDEAPRAAFIVQSENYHNAINLALIRGRNFLNTDNENGQKVVLVSQQFVDQHWPGESGIGNRFRFANTDKEEEWMTIVGIAGNLVQRPQSDEKAPMIYLPFKQRPWDGMSILLKTDSDPLSLTKTVREIVNELDSELPLFEIRTLRQALDRNIWFFKVFGTLFLVFAAVGLLMASIGVYAVVAQSMAQRTQEIGIRMALGASKSKVLLFVIAKGLRQLAIGLVIGFGLSVVTNRMVAGDILENVSPWDPIVLISVGLLVPAIGTFACWLPARKAASLHPSIALRGE